MNQNTKQRVVGSVVLLALALIFLPIVFDGQGSYQQQISSRIPDPPAIEPLPEPVQQRPRIVAETEAINLPQDPVASNSSEADASVSQVPANAGVSDPDQAIAIVSSQPAFTTAQLSAEEKPSLDRQGIPQGWSVQLGSFSEFANADNLVSRLHASGYKAYTRELVRDSGILTSVFVGPWLDRPRVDTYQKQLQDEFQLSGVVVPFAVDKVR